MSNLLARALDDDALMAAAAAGVGGAFGELALRHRGYLVRTARRALGGDGHAAQDVAQEALVDFYRAVPRYRARGRLRPLLYVITLNRVRMSARRRRHQLVELAAAEHVPSGHRGADEELVHSERCREVRAAILALSARVRVVVMMHYASGRTHTEIARALAIPVGTVKSRLAAGLAELRRTITAG